MANLANCLNWLLSLHIYVFGTEKTSPPFLGGFVVYLLSRFAIVFAFAVPYLSRMEKQVERLLTVELSRNPTSGNFFIDFSDNGVVLCSVKITEAQALWYGTQLSIKILE